MNEVLFISITVAAFAATSLIAWVLAWLITDVSPIRIPVKPFNCRPCCTFWLTFILCGVLSYNLMPHFPGVQDVEGRTATLGVLIALSFTTALIAFLNIKLKFRVYE